MLNNLKRGLACLGLAGLPLVAAAQEKPKPKPDTSPVQWIETHFHRVHLKNGNFIDGSLVSKDRKTVVLKMKPGNFGIRTDMIDRVEYVKMRSLQEAPKTIDIKSEPTVDGPPAAARPEAAATPVVPLAESSKGLAETLSADTPERRRTKLRELWDAKGAEAPAFIAALLERLAPEARFDVVALLIEKEAAAALPTLVKLLKNADGAVREQSLKAIQSLGTEETLPQIEFCLSDPDPLVRASVLMVFQQLGGADDFEKVADKLKDVDPSVRGTALSVLQALSKRLNLREELVKTLREEIADSTPETAVAIVTALGKLNDRELGPELAKYAEAADPGVRGAAVSALVTTDPKLAEQVILERITVETEYAPRIQLSEGARKLRLKSVIEPLIEWLQSEDVNIQSSATSALKAITGQAFGLDHDRWAEWWEQAKPKK